MTLISFDWRSTPDKRVYDVATTLILGHSLLLVAASAAATPLLARWYGNREFVPAYLVTLLTIPLAGIAGPPTAKLEREFNFRAVAGIELGGQVLALVVSVVMAWRGFGVWAPVTGLLAWQAWAAIGAMAKAKLAPALKFDVTQARTMLSFGAGYSASLRVWQLRTLVNPLLVGRFAGTEAVAFVALAIRIAEGLGFVRIAAGRLAIAALSRLQHDRPEIPVHAGKCLEDSGAHTWSVTVPVRADCARTGPATDGSSLAAELAGISVRSCRSPAELDVQPAGLCAFS